MNPWTAFAQAIVYPIARAIADAYFDAREKYNHGVEEVKNEQDIIRASNLSDAVKRLHEIDESEHSRS